MNDFLIGRHHDVINLINIKKLLKLLHGICYVTLYHYITILLYTITISSVMDLVNKRYLYTKMIHITISFLDHYKAMFMDNVPSKIKIEK